MTQKTETPATSPLRTAASTQGSASGIVNEAKHALVDVAGLAAEQAGSSIKETVSGTKEKAAEGLGSVVQALRGAGAGLGDESDVVRGYVDQVADRVDSLSKYVQNREVSQIVADVERMARREPALFIGGAFVLGLFTARFLKSSVQAGQGSVQAGQGGPVGRLAMSGEGPRVQYAQAQGAVRAQGAMRGPTAERSQSVQVRRPMASPASNGGASTGELGAGIGTRKS